MQPKTDAQVAHLVHNMIKNEGKKRVKFAELGIKYEFPGFASFVPHEEPKPKSKGAKATKASKGAKPAKKTPKAK